MKDIIFCKLRLKFTAIAGIERGLIKGGNTLSVSSNIFHIEAVPSKLIRA